MDSSNLYIYMSLGVKDKQFHSAKMFNIDLDTMNNTSILLMESQNDTWDIKKVYNNMTIKYRVLYRNYKGDELPSLNGWLTGWLVLNMVVLYRKITHTHKEATISTYYYP